MKKRSLKRNILASLLAFLLVIGIAAPAYSTIATDTPMTLYSVYVGNTVGGELKLLNRSTGEALDATVSGADNGWRVITFLSSEEFLDLQLIAGDGPATRVAAGNDGRFVMRPGYNIVYLMPPESGGAVQTTYISTNNDGRFTVLVLTTRTGNVYFPGAQLGWTVTGTGVTLLTRVTGASQTELQGLLTPPGVTSTAYAVHSRAYEFPRGSHEFKIHTGAWSEGSNATLIIRLLGVIITTETVVGVGSHEIEARFFTDTGDYTPDRDALKWSHGSLPAGVTFDTEKGVVTVSNSTPVNSVFEVSCEYEGKISTASITYRSLTINNAFAEGIRTIMLRTNAATNNFGGVVRNMTTGEEVPVISAAGDPRGAWTNRGAYSPSVTLTTGVDLDPTHWYRIENSGTNINIVMRAILNDYANLEVKDLGVNYTPDTTVFKVWAPIARQAEVAVYLTLNQTLGGSGDFATGGGLNNSKRDNPDLLIPMTLVDNVWVAEHNNNEVDLDGAFYLYKLQQSNNNNNNTTLEYVLDPYASAAAGNGRVSAIVDFAKTPEVRPLNKDLAPVVNTYSDHVLYEVHVRDFSIHPSSGISEENKGKFLAFTERGTTAKDPVTGEELLHNGKPISTGLDHIIELGVTTVHLLPVYDINSLNELRVGDWSYGAGSSFNWGYDPLNYNALEGTYSSNPRDPYARVNEFKELVSALHDAGIRVVVDVVYNHTANTSVGGSPFRTAPGYFYRTWDNGNNVNPGFGNDVATERAMVRKYIVDSVLWWQSEFKVDGFRFDLMGCHDYITMEEVVKELRKVDPEVIVYGEPWDLAVGLPREQTALVGTQMDKGWAFFNDQLRNAVRGGNRDSGRGFAHGANMGRAVAAGATADYNYVARASEIVNYVSKHDDLILWDTTVLSLGNDRGGVSFTAFTGTGTPNATTRTYGDNPYRMVDLNNVFGNNPVRASVLSQGIVFTSQGIPFFAGGCEFLRSKLGNADSYNSGDVQNALRWNQKAMFMPVYEYYQGLIELRALHPAFRLDELGDIAKSMELLRVDNNVVAYVLKDYAGVDTWKNIYVAYNGNHNTSVTVNFGTESNLTIVANHEAAGVKPLGTIEGGIFTLPPLSMVVAYDTETYIVSATPSAFVTVRPGNTNDLTITVTERYSNGTVVTFTETFSIRNNAEDTYTVNGYRVFVNTKGNDQIRAINIVK